MNIPKVRDLLKSQIVLSNNIFPNGKRPTNSAVRVIYHLPGQFLLAGHNQKFEWPYRATNESYMIRFLIGSNTIMRKRHKRKNRCIESNEKYDDWVMQVYKDEAKCNVPYLKQNKMFPMCDSKILMKQGLLTDYIVEKKKLDKPCKAMTGINVEHVETTSGEKNHIGKFWLGVTFQQSTFIEIEQIR